MLRLDIPDKAFGRPRFVHDLELPAHAARARAATALARRGAAVGRRLQGARARGRGRDRARRQFRRRARRARGGRGQGARAVERRRGLDGARDAPRCGDARRLAEVAAGRDEGGRGTRGRKRAGGGAHAARPVLAPLPRARLDRSVVRARAVAGRRAAGLVPQPGRLQPARRSRGRRSGSRAERIVVAHVEGAGCYGHNGADDVALDAALLARAAGGRPVRLVWTRADELAWSPFGPAMAIELEADLDAAGEVLAWRHDLWSNGHSSRPGRAATPTLLAAAHLERPFDRVLAINPPLPAGGADRNAVPLYDFPARRIVNHRLLSMPLRASALRSLGAFANVFAIESFVDELAARPGRGSGGVAPAPPRRSARARGDRGGRAARRMDAAGSGARPGATASASRSTRTSAPTARSSPRSRPSARSACAASWSRSTSAS